MPLTITDIVTESAREHGEGPGSLVQSAIPHICEALEKVRAGGIVRRMPDVHLGELYDELLIVQFMGSQVWVLATAPATLAALHSAFYVTRQTTDMEVRFLPGPGTIHRMVFQPYPMPERIPSR